MRYLHEVEALLGKAHQELRELKSKVTSIEEQIRLLEKERILALGNQNTKALDSQTGVSNYSSEEEKIVLFRGFFRGREDVYPKRFESRKTGKSGYQPSCANEWARPVCQKPRVKCGDCTHRAFLPVTDDTIRYHLLGREPGANSGRDFTIGVYPLLEDESCWFLAVDFDKADWTTDALAYLETCEEHQVPAALERSRSGNGGHVWVFFSESIPARQARRLGSYLLTETMERRPEVGLDSYDRFFPNQDTMPNGGFGNLIALPLQRIPRNMGNSLFVDKNLVPFPDQWAFLSSLEKMSRSELEAIVGKAEQEGRIIGVCMATAEEDDATPWTRPPSGRKSDRPITEPLPKVLDLVLGNQIYIGKEKTPPPLLNQLIRLAAFQNPEFYKAQAMRFSTFDKPRIISCCENFPQHIGLPRGCLDEVIGLLDSHGVDSKIVDERFSGNRLNACFDGELRDEQAQAVDALLQSDTGVLAASTAFGKTVVACHMIAKRSVNTLILVHRKVLLEQWIERLCAFLDVKRKDVGRIGGGKKKPTGIIDVAVIQSLNKKGVVDDLVADYGHLIVDECHHLSARSFEVVARQAKARYVLGLSATTTRKDGHHPIIFMQCGPERYRVDNRKQAEVRPFQHKVFFKETGVCLPESLRERERVPIHELYSLLMQNSARNTMIIQDVIDAVKQGRSPLVLTERTEHLDFLAEQLASFVKNTIVLKGGMGKRQQKQVDTTLAAIPENEPRIIVATGRYLGEGFDDARLDTLFLTLPVSWCGTLAQYTGRLHRLHDRKNVVIVYDYADLQIQAFVNMYKKRQRGYRTIGYEIVEVGGSTIFKDSGTSSVIQ